MAKIVKCKFETHHMLIETKSILTLLTGVALALSLLLLFSRAVPAYTTDYRFCLECHEGIERMNNDHAFTCVKCHLLPADRGLVLDTHSKVLRYPGAPEHVETLCGECHQKEIALLRNSLHYTLAGIIGQTRYLWGAQETPVPKYSPSEHTLLKKLPRSKKQPETAADLVDDLLQRRCFRCHLGQRPPERKGLYRGVGCGACHVPYADDGIYRGGDPTLWGKRGYPQTHTFARPISVEQCLHCHNGPRVGADYVGLFEHDYHMSYRTPWVGGSMPEPIYLMDHHQLSKDIHQERGLLCVDCHDQGDVMGRGKMFASQLEAISVRCDQCHGPLSPASQHVERVFLDRQGREHPLPQWNTSVPAHGIEEMRRLHCTSCHATWGFYDYGLSLLRDDRTDLSRWGPWRLQGNDMIARLFDHSGRFLGLKEVPGPWFTGWRFRRWENLTLGVDSKGRIAPFRPHYQYMISFVDQEGRVVMDNVIPQREDQNGRGWAYMPFYPHTVRPRGRSCEDCHGQRLAVGKGYGEAWGQDLSLAEADRPVYPELRLLGEKEMERLTEKTPLYQHVRSQITAQEEGMQRLPKSTVHPRSRD